MACHYIQFKDNIPDEITADVLQIPSGASSTQGKSALWARSKLSFCYNYHFPKIIVIWEVAISQKAKIVPIAVV